MKFTVIIPTRERADTLYYSLKTCVTQDYDDLEILVSDNFSQDNTREVVESFKDPRIRYINTGKRVSMTSNWEFALSNVDGDYVSCIGDDDGLLPHAICRANEILTQVPAPALCHKHVRYFWPSCHEQSDKNLLAVPFGNTLFKVSGRKAFKAAKLLFFIGGLPSIYNGFVRLSVLRTIKARTGRFFSSMIPDYYCSFAVMAVTEFYLSFYRALGVRGTSADSNGDAFLRRGLRDPVARRFFQDGPLMPPHPAIKLTDRLPVLSVAEPLLQVVSLFSNSKSTTVSMMRVLSIAYKTIASMSSDEYNEKLRVLREMAQLNRLGWFARLCELRFPNRLPRDGSGSRRLSTIRDLTVDAASFGVTNVYDASLLAEKLLGPYPPPTVPTSPYTYTTALKERLSGQL